MTRVGGYELEGEIGRGGVGVVYRARTSRGEPVALKLVPRSDALTVARFEREVRILRSLGEAEGFVPLLDAGTSEAGPFLVMPLLRGGTLRDRLDRGPLPLSEVRRVGAALARALGEAHARGIVHRDVKPENVLFTVTDAPLLADLGLAKHFSTRGGGESAGSAGADGGGGSLASAGLSRTGELKGTAGYLAPEQIADARSADGRADTFALGAILYEAIAGAPAFPGATVLEVLTRIAEGRFEPLGGRAPADLARLVESCLGVRPADRPASVLDVARALGGESVRLPKRARAPRRRRAALVLGGLVGALAVALAVDALLAVGRRPESAGGEQPATAEACIERARDRALRREDGPALDLVALGIDRAKDLPAEERLACASALGEVAAAVGSRAFEVAAWSAEGRAYALERALAALARREGSPATPDAEERHLAAQVLAGTLGHGELRQRALPPAVLARPPLLLACGHLYDLALVQSSSAGGIEELDRLAADGFPIPEARRAAVAERWLGEARRRHAEYVGLWSDHLTDVTFVWSRGSALFAGVIAALARARAAEPALGPCPPGTEAIFEDLEGLLYRDEQEIQTKWGELARAIPRLGEHPLGAYLDCRRAAEALDRDAILRAARRAAALLAPYGHGRGAAALAELFAFGSVIPGVFHDSQVTFAPGVEDAAPILRQLADASGSLELAEAVAQLDARRAEGVSKALHAWRDRMRATITAPEDADPAAGKR